MAATTAAVVAVGLAVGSAIEQRKEAKAAAKDQKEAAAISRAEQQAQQANQRRQQAREERIRRAQILQSSENTGVSSSSGALGSVGALGTSTASNIASLSRQSNAAMGVENAMASAAGHQLKQQEAAQMGQLAGTIFTGAQGFGAFEPTAASKGGGTPVAGASSPVEVPNPYSKKNIFG